MPDRTPRNGNSSLRPRWSAWWRSLGWLLLGCAFYSGFPFTPSTQGRFLVYAALWFLALAHSIWSECRGTPARLRYWRREDGIGLTVRSLHTREILLTSVSESLAGFDLAERALAGAGLADLDLQNANLARADLHGADLSRARLNGANLEQADLRGANLRSANLSKADLQGADLRHARLIGTHFYGADLRNADLRGADLGGRGLSRVVWGLGLESARLEGTHYDAATRWPPGFDPAVHGCILSENAETALPIPSASEVPHPDRLPVPAERPQEETPALQYNRPVR